MRLQKTITLDENRSATIHELRVKDVRNIVAQVKSLDEADIRVLFSDRFDEMTGLLDSCLSLPDGESLADLTFSELNKIKDAVLEVNAAFLDLLGLAGLPMTIPSSSSTEPAPTSSSEDTPT